MYKHHRHSVLERTPVNAPHSDTARVRRVVETGDEHLRRTLQHRRCGNVLHNLVKQIGDVRCRCLPVGAHPALLCRAEHHGEVQLLLRGIKGKHQVEHHFVHLVGAAVRLVHLVYHHDGFQSYLQRLLQHKPRLRHRTLEGIHQQQAAVCHIQHTLHLSAEVAMSWRVDDVDFHAPIDDGDVLRQDGYSPLAFQVVAVQYTFGIRLVVLEKVSSQHHLVHQRCLAVVNVGNNGNVSDILFLHIQLLHFLDYLHSFSFFSKIGAKVHIFSETFRVPL